MENMLASSVYPCLTSRPPPFTVLLPDEQVGTELMLNRIKFEVEWRIVFLGPLEPPLSSIVGNAFLYTVQYCA